MRGQTLQLLRDPPLHLQLWKETTKGKTAQTCSVPSRIDILYHFFKTTTKKVHYCCYLWLMHSPCFQLLLPIFYSVENSCMQYPALHHLQSTCISLSPENGQIFRRSAFFCTRSRNSGPREHLLYSIETQVMVKIHAQQRSGESLCIMVNGAFLVDKVLQAMYSRTPI